VIICIVVVIWKYIPWLVAVIIHRELIYAFNISFTIKCVVKPQEF